MQLISIVNGTVWSVQPTHSLRAQQNPDGTFDYEGDSFGAQYADAADLMVLPDGVDVDVGSEIDPSWHAVEIPLTQLLAPSAEGAQADALGLVMRAAIAEGDITDDELLRVAPALEERKWHVGLDVQAGDVYSFHSLLWVCVQAHRTQMGWEPGKLPSLWRRVEAIQPEEVRVWALHVDYSAGDVVAYPEESSPEYTCLTGHTSQAGWEPPYVPALWQLHNRG